MAQLVARLVRNEKVRGSNPLSSTILADKYSHHISVHLPKFAFRKSGIQLDFFGW